MQAKPALRVASLATRRPGAILGLPGLNRAALTRMHDLGFSRPSLLPPSALATVNSRRTMSSNANAQVSSSTLPLANLPPILHRLHEAKAKKGLTFSDIGKSVGRDECWVAALFYAQAKPTPDDITGLAKVLEIDAGSIRNELGDHWFPNRGDLGPIPPKDATIYRLYEGVLVYGHAIKAVIHEKFGDGIMSLIDCKVTVDKKPDPKGDRVILTFDGKFLPYIKW